MRTVVQGVIQDILVYILMAGAVGRVIQHANIFKLWEENLPTIKTRKKIKVSGKHSSILVNMKVH